MRAFEPPGVEQPSFVVIPVVARVGVASSRGGGVGRLVRSGGTTLPADGVVVAVVVLGVGSSATGTNTVAAAAAAAAAVITASVASIVAIARAGTANVFNVNGGAVVCVDAARA